MARGHADHTQFQARQPQRRYTMTIQKLLTLATLAAAATTIAPAALATPEDSVQQLVKKAIGHLKASGLQQACADFGDPAKGYMAGESYVFIQDMHAKMVCNPSNPRIVGKDLSELRDTDGVAFSSDMVRIAKASGSGWVEYKWVNPATKQLQKKKSYVERSDDYVVGSGFYK
ncbi:cache domain-containing protein [Duganella sp. LX20W]|uniref:Cache domain-containing protein n=1 Tax=Rugamonas brunnea TaxID=2758569 RepID=A0A7W2IDJ1_9BURK|nr:cache domain-containing protein [Rugamonas brunnea]MBA5639330.1 cache domain-containing protein [Rugamonas brunnea]